MMFCICPLGALVTEQGRCGKFDCVHPHGTTGPAGCVNPQDPTPGEEGTVWVPTNLLESGSDSLAPPKQLAATEDPVLGSLGCMEVRDIRFSVVDTSDTS